jgi:parallel beta-helix repeat protein
MYSGTANNCIVWYNDGPVSNNLYYTTSHYTCSPDAIHGVDGNITNAPSLASFSHIGSDSPCRSAGSSAYASGMDIDGEFWQSPPSMGCDEYYGSITGALQVAIASSVTNVATGYSLSIQGFVDGAAEMHVWDFNDGRFETNNLRLAHAWSSPGTYALSLTALNGTYPSGVSVTQEIIVVDRDANAIYVASDGNDFNDGSSWITAKATIQAGVEAQIYYGGLVLVSNGTYTVASEIVVDKDITIQSLNGPSSTIIDGQGSVRGFNLGNYASVLSGLTIANGHADADGGGIYCTGSTPIITNCTITGNIAVGYGGGISHGTESNCLIISNSAFHGGGLYSGTANNCTIRGNSSSQFGGGIYQGIVNSSTISGNTSGYHGGGMFQGTANNCTISGNSAQKYGGGIYLGIVNSSTISGNTAGEYAGGMFQGTANNCVVWYNSAPTAGNLYITTAHYTCSPDVIQDVDGNITNAPLFADISGADYHLMSNSPCVNWGNSAYVTGSMDIDGLPRVAGGYVDMGAYEYQGTIMADNDEDGLPDEWEREYFASNVDPSGHADLDRLSNGAEYIAGTDPTNSASCFAITNFAPTSGFAIEWSCATGRWYNVLWRESLTNSYQSLQDYIEYPQNSYTDAVHSTEAAGFYTVEVRLK